MNGKHIKYSKFDSKCHIPVLFSSFECEELFSFNKLNDTTKNITSYNKFIDCNKSMASNELNFENLKVDVLLRNEEKIVVIPEEVKEIMKPFQLTEIQVRNIIKRLDHDMSMGLDPAKRDKACVKMYPSYITDIPSGNERGDFLALDLGGTNYRILLIKMVGNHSPPEVIESSYSIPEIKMHGTGEELFDFIAETIVDFLKPRNLLNKELPLGFTFSFPCEQKGLQVAVLTRWTKGFTALNVEGTNIHEWLTKSLNKYHLKVKCKAIVNDTVGTLASCSLIDPYCAIGMIVGTGSNACYIEKVANVMTINKEMVAKNASHLIINTEWGAFGENGTLEDIRTKFDRTLDKQSLHPGKQIFEKLISGMYLGELVRLVLLNLIEKKLLFKGNIPVSLSKPNTFKTKYMSDIDRDPPHLFYSSEYLLRNELEISKLDTMDLKITRYVCELVGRRAAFLAGSGLVVLMNRMEERKNITVGVDGSLFRHHPSFAAYLHACVRHFKRPNLEFLLRLSEDGSGIGAAALVASIEAKYKA